MSAPPPTSRANKHISALSTAPTLVDAAGASESPKGINEKRFSDDKILKSEVVNTVQPVSPSEEPSRVASPEQADDVVVVHFQAGDPNDPRNWPRWYRWYLSIFGCILVFTTTFASSAPSGFALELAEEFKLTSELVALTITLFVVGFCVGPLLWGPLSEQYGRKTVLLPCFLIFTAFQIGSALSKNAASVMVFRLLAGIFSAASHPIAPAMMADVWDPATREKALIYLGFFSFIGPTTGPLVGGYMAAANIEWQWCFWLLSILTGTCTVIIALTQKETYRPILLERKAARLRAQTGDARYHSPLELTQRHSLAGRLAQTFTRPFIVFVREPTLIATTVYLAFIGGCLYMLFEAYPIVFEVGYHFKPAQLGLAYLPLTVGNIVAVIFYLLVIQPSYERRVRECAPAPVPPEERLKAAIWAAPLFAVSFFWFGWTSFPTISFWAPLMSGFTLGIATLALLVALMNYVVDVYASTAASALGIVTVLRSISGAVFPLFSTQMFRALNPRWASTIVGCVAVAMIPIPFVLTRFGPSLRKRSRYVAPETV